MKTLVDFNDYAHVNKGSGDDFEKLRSKYINKATEISNSIFKKFSDFKDNEYDADETDKELPDNIDDTLNKDTPMDNEQTSDDPLDISGGNHIQTYNSHPFGIGTAPNMYKSHVTKVEPVVDMTGIPRR